MGNQYTGYQRWVKPAVRDVVTTGQSAGTITGNWAISVPALTQAGDLLVLFISCNQDAVTPASGWTLKQNGVSAGTSHQSLLYTRLATSADVGGSKTYTWNLSGTTAAPDCAIMYAVSFTTATTAADYADAISTESTTGTSFTSPSVGSPGGPSLRIHFAANRQSTATPITYSWGSGATTVEVTNSGTVSYTASSAYEGGITYGGSAGGRSNTASATPTSQFEYQIAMKAEQANDGPLPHQTNSLRRPNLW